MCDTMIMAKKIIDAVNNEEVRNNLEYELDAYYKIMSDNQFYKDEYNSLVSILNNTGFNVIRTDENHHIIRYRRTTRHKRNNVRRVRVILLNLS